MLVIDIKINHDKIDTLQIQRIKSTKSGFNTYKIIQPKGWRSLKVKHHYDEGYFALFTKVMVTLYEHGYNPKPKYTWKELRKMIDERETQKREELK